MKIATLVVEGAELAAVRVSRGYVTLPEVNRQAGTGWSGQWLPLLAAGQWAALRCWVEGEGRLLLEQMPALDADACTLAPLYRQPRKIIGVGMNYVEKLVEFQGNPDDPDPVIFLKPDTSLIGPGEPVRLPPEQQSRRVTAEAELAVVIGRRCRDVAESEAPGVVAGFTASLDMTAADLLAANPKFMARAKSFDTFFSLGGELITPDEGADWQQLWVETVHDDGVVSRNTVSMMRFNPWFIVSFVSKVMTLLPGDIIMTGTPGSIQVLPGDSAECRITGLSPLRNPVLAAHDTQ